MSMEPIYAICVGLMFSIGVYMLLARHLMKFVFGVMVLGNAVNLAIFTAGRITGTSPPFVPEGMEAPIETVSNSLPQALILTAIVIGFGLLAFTLGLGLRAMRDLGTLDMDEASDETESPIDTRGENA